MAQELRPDICVIGAGEGGLAAAATAAACRAATVLIENAEMGSVNLNSGSLPSQALISAAAHINAARTGVRFGLAGEGASIDFAAVRAYVRDVISAAAPQDARERFAGLGVRVVAGRARFLDAHTLAAEDFIVKARHFILATGSLPALPSIPGLGETPCLTSETIFNLTACPRHLIVIGAGSTGLELAQIFRRVGAEVTVLEAATPLASDDAECAAVVLDALELEGIKLRTGVVVAGVRSVASGIEIDVTTPNGNETIEGTHLLIAVGRQPDIEGLNLEAAGIRHLPNGILVDKLLRTTNKHVYAIGDITNGPKFVHAARHHAGLVVRHALFRLPFKVEDRAIPTVTYTDPELAQVGLLEGAARAHVGSICILRWPYRENDRAQATAATNGHIKIVTDRKGAILGATIVGAGASENITAWTLAIDRKLNIHAFTDLVVPYPTYAEVGKRAAITYFMRGLTSNRVRRIIGWLRRVN